MKLKPILQSQYLSALAMLRRAIAQCPPQAWDNPNDKDRFWFVAYHALRFAHQYLKANDKGYPRWEQRWHSSPGRPFSKEEILEKLAIVERDVVEQIVLMDLEAKTGAAGALANKFELQLYNIRHIQQHTGELYEKLSAYPVKLGWASQRYNRKRKK
ncbi:MAG: hypothetical protein IT313_03145 [Anaerolineales bacterium]|nr:hypothetical protein [Anaerolineales bacterium]